MTKLHLGCGEKYLDGYCNIDYPPTNHTVQTNTKVDEYANLLEMKKSAGSIHEIRLHHVFEHFDRPTAMALLFSWNNWLSHDGILRIEVPDYFWSGLFSLMPFVPQRKRLIATRHVFGSHEAFWAIHCEGWTKSTLRDALHVAGFKLIKTRRSNWRGTFNLEVIAQKHEAPSTEKLKDFFKLYTLDDSSTELQLLDVWTNNFNKQYSKMTER
jgi:hypothetical protein